MAGNPRLAKPRLGLSADRCSATRCVVTSRGVNVPRIQSPLRGSEPVVAGNPRLAEPRLGLSADRCSAARGVVTLTAAPQLASSNTKNEPYPSGHFVDNPTRQLIQ